MKKDPIKQENQINQPNKIHEKREHVQESNSPQKRRMNNLMKKAVKIKKKKEQLQDDKTVNQAVKNVQLFESIDMVNAAQIKILN